ncbi:MAG: hypothetical protein R3C18_23495 [Planctomycetaceae bacterium]
MSNWRTDVPQIVLIKKYKPEMIAKGGKHRFESVAGIRRTTE